MNTQRFNILGNDKEYPELQIIMIHGSMPVLAIQDPDGTLMPLADFNSENDAEIFAKWLYCLVSKIEGLS